jgi:surface antigen
MATAKYNEQRQRAIDFIQSQQWQQLAQQKGMTQQVNQALSSAGLQPNTQQQPNFASNTATGTYKAPDVSKLKTNELIPWALKTDFSKIDVKSIDPAKYQYWKEAIDLGINQQDRNLQLWAWAAWAWLKSQDDIMWELMKNASYAAMDEDSKKRTAADVYQKMWEYQASQTEWTPEWTTVTPWTFMKDWVETPILWYGDLDPEMQKLVDWMTDAQKKMLDMMWGSDANAAAEYLRQAKREQEYQTWQRDLTIKINDLQWNVLEIQSSQRLRDAGKQVDNLIQNYAYLGSMWAPWVSQQRLTAVKDHIVEAEKKFAEMKQIESHIAQIRELWLEMDTAAFEKQMADISDDLNMKVGMQIQNALNDMTAADLAWQLDTIDWVTQFKRSLLEKLDANINWYTQWSMQQMQYVTEQYTKIADDAQARIKEWTTNANTINKDMSIAQGYYVDGNGNPVYNSSWQPIMLPEKPPMDPIYDKEKWQLITFSTDANGQIVANVQQVTDQVSVQTSWIQAMANMWYSIEEIQKVFKDVDPNLIVAAVKQFEQQSEWPSFTPVDPVKQQQALQQVIAQWDGSMWWQCWAFVNDYLQSMWLDRMFIDPIDAKKAVMNSDTPTIWSVAVIDWSDNPNATLAQQKYWHVGIVTAINKDWTVTLKQSNKKWDELVFTSNYKTSQISWYFDPTKASETPSKWKEIMWSLWLPVSYERSVKNFVPATLMNSEIELKQLNETIKSMYKWWVAEEDAALYFMWFNIKDEANKWLAKELVAVWRSLPEDMQQSFVKSISDFMNSGNIDWALRKAEQTAMNYAKKIEWGNFMSESSVKTAVQRSNDIYSYVSWLKNSPIWVAQWTMQKWLGKLKGKEAQTIQTQITQAVAQMRNQLLWSAVTPSEQAFLAPLIPDLNDTPANFMIKLNNLKNAPLQQYNNIRTTYWLPALDEDSLLNFKNRVNLYRWGWITEDVQPKTQTWWGDTWADFDL